MSSWMVWVQRPSGLMKIRVEAKVLSMERGRITLIKVENVL
jgi:hypothetical protein